MDEHVVPMGRRHAPAVATLHRNGIATGLLSHFEERFLREIYESLCVGGFGRVSRP